MTYQQFAEYLSNELTLFLEGDVHAEIHSSLKNNGLTRLGVTICDPRINISPTIYLEDFYKQHQDGTNLLDIIQSLIAIYEDVRFDCSWQLEEFYDFNAIQHKIAYKIIHKKDNAQLLQDVPHVPFHDLAVVFYLLMELSPNGLGTVLITNDMADFWEITAAELYETAAKNTPLLLPVEFKPMRLAVYEMLGTSNSYDDYEDNHMYVLTNSLHQFGAASILYNNVLEFIANELRDDYYILPSSIHEVIILPKRYSPSPEELNQMIIDINETQVAVDEVLSNHAYYYSQLHKSLFLTH